MTTPTAGPDDRSPRTEEQQALNEFRAWFLESYPKDCVIFDPSWHVASIFRAATHHLVSALRSARRDVARLEWVMASSYQGIMVEPHTVRPGLIAEGTQYGPYHVDATREGIDAAMPQ